MRYLWIMSLVIASGETLSHGDGLDWNSIQEKENQIEVLVKDIQSQGLSTSELQNRLKTYIDSLSDDQRLSLHQGNFDKEILSKSAGFAQIQLDIQKTDAAYLQLQKQLDELVQQEMLTLLNEVKKASDSLHSECIRKSCTAAPAVKKFYEIINKNYGYMFPRSPKDRSSFRYYGTAKGRVLGDHFYQTILGFKNLLDALSPAPAPKIWSLVTSKIEEWSNLAQTLPHLTQFLSAILLHPNNRNGVSPVSRSVDQLLQSLSSKTGYQIRIEGRDRIPELDQDPMSLNLIVPTHRSGPLDALLMGSLGLKDYLILASYPDWSLPSWAKKYLEQKVEFLVPVGQGHSTLEETLRRIKSGGIRNVVVYPEGVLPGGFGETHPIPNAFESRYIRGLQKAGYRVNIVPIAYLGGDELLMGQTVSPPAVLKASIAHALNAESLTLLSAIGGSGAVGRFIRAAWIESYPTDETQIMGHKRIGAFLPQFVENLKPSRMLPELCHQAFEGLLIALPPKP